MGARTTLLVTLALAAVVLPTACFGGGDEPIGYLHRPDSILIQKKTAVSPPGSVLPDLTLYGDGTLIYLERPGEQTSPLLQTQLPDDAVRDLLELLIDEGFFDFAYEQPKPERATSQPRTYVYIRTMDAANAVSAYAIDSVLPDDAGDEFDDFRGLQRIVDDLDAVDPVALGGSAPVRYQPDQYLMTSRTLGDDAEVSERVLGADEVIEALRPFLDDGSWTFGEAYGPAAVQSEGRPAQELYWRPLLPFEENFPEFDLP